MFPAVASGTRLMLIAFDRPFFSCRATVFHRIGLQYGPGGSTTAGSRQAQAMQGRGAIWGRCGPIGAPSSLLTSIQLLYLAMIPCLGSVRTVLSHIAYCARLRECERHALLFFFFHSHCPAHEFETPCEERKKRSLCRFRCEKGK